MADEKHEDPNSGQEQGEENQEVLDDGSGGAGNDPEDTAGELTPEQYRANLTRANAQAAAERVKRQEALTELEAVRAKIGEMKSIEEVDGLLAEYEGKLTAAEAANNRLLAAQAAGLPAGFEARLQGGTYDELLEDAKALAPLVVAQKNPPAPLPMAGGRDPKPTGEGERGSGYRAAKSKHTF